jgi:hypothetical protein
VKDFDHDRLDVCHYYDTLLENGGLNTKTRRHEMPVFRALALSWSIHVALQCHRAAIDFICMADEVVERLPRKRTPPQDRLHARSHGAERCRLGHGHGHEERRM